MMKLQINIFERKIEEETAGSNNEDSTEGLAMGIRPAANIP